MKKTLHRFTLVFALAALSFPASVGAAIGNTATHISSSSSIKEDSLLVRLNEIKDINKASLSTTEKKQLKKEVRSIKKRIKDSRGVYISLGALIIIVLLLILIL